MLSKIKKSDGEGFTIIEVMIVLAIAALILLIVLLAVPALQRSARNTQRKNDIGQVATAVANFISNNGGALPTATGFETADPTQVVVYCQGSGPTGVTGMNSDATVSTLCTTSNTNTETAKMGHYSFSSTAKYAEITDFGTTSTGYAAVPAGTTGSPSITNITPESFTIVDGVGCNTTNTGLATTANSRTAAILYATENANGASLQCVEQ